MLRHVGSWENQTPHRSSGDRLCQYVAPNEEQPSCPRSDFSCDCSPVEDKHGQQKPGVKSTFAPVVLVVDDDAEVAKSHAALLSNLGYGSIVQTDPIKVEAQLDQHSEIGAVLLDIRMPGMDGLDLLQRIRLRRPDVGVIMATVVSDIEQAVIATRSGAYNYLLKPLQVVRLERVLSSFFSNQPQRISEDPRFNGFITKSKAFKEVFRRVQAFAAAEVPVLIQGETGTGKELIARLIHSLSPRRSQRFLAVNAAALSPQLFESELFGHTRGAFTGAIRDRAGYLEAAADGTLFLDEIGELGLEQQKKLLRVLQENAFSRVGDTTERPLASRLVLATNRDLREEVKKESFRADFYYRFSSHTIHLPPLRSRPEDIELLANYFLEKYCSQFGRAIAGLARETLEILQRYPFPGNVRELDGYLSAAVLLEQTPYIQAEALPDHVRFYRDHPEESGDLESARYQLILRTVAECGGNQTKAAEKLGIARGTLNRLLKEFRTRSQP